MSDPKRWLAAGVQLPLGTAWMLASVMEAKGKQELWLRKRPETLAALRQQALIQSVESSNRIEGVTVAPGRLRPLLLERSRPRDRSEEELAGYRRALDWIFARPADAPLDAGVVKRLHNLAQGGFSGDAGQWKKRDNEIIELLANGERRIRFVPTSAKEVPRAIKALCLAYRDAVGRDDAPALLAAAWFVFEFLCIHPFRDGNGRVSRLLTTLLLERHGFVVCRFISLERLVEASKAEYYDVLERCSVGWHGDRNEIVPWLNYFLGLLRRAYGELAERVDAAEDTGKSELVRRAVLDRDGAFTLAELRAACPSASAQLIKKVLSEMKAAGKVGLVGRGRGARWRMNPE